jgi:hypothetical protein
MMRESVSKIKINNVQYNIHVMVVARNGSSDSIPAYWSTLHAKAPNNNEIIELRL